MSKRKGNLENENVKTLKRLKSACEDKLLYFERKLPEYKTIGEFQSALNRLKPIYTQYDEVIPKLEMLDKEFVSNRDEFENKFGTIEATMLDEISKINFNLSSEMPSTSTPTLPRFENNVNVSLKMPDIPLPKFKGEEENWLEFRDLFSELIHKNSKLNNILKFHYLISCVREGKAYQYIQPFPVSADNYELAVAALFEHYNSDLKIQNSHIKRIYDVKRPIENSAQSLQLFLDTINKSYNALKSLNLPVESWNPLLCYHLFERLDDSSKTDIINKFPPNQQLTYTKLVELLSVRIKVLEAKRSAISSFSNKSGPTGSSRAAKAFVETTIQCPFCKESHDLKSCLKFTDKSVTPRHRYNFVRQIHYCYSCLNPNHRPRTCQYRCNICGYRHNELLHLGQSTLNETVNSSQSKKSKNESVSLASMCNSNYIDQNKTENDETSVDCNLVSDEDSSQILLATAVIWIRNKSGVRVPCRALLDCGSQANFISTDMCNKLGLPTTPTNIKVSGINNNVTTINRKLNLEIGSQNSDYSSIITCLVKHKIAGTIPSKPVIFDTSMIPRGIRLADPYFAKPEKIDILLGAESFIDVIKPERLELLEGNKLQNSEFGYIIMGRVSNNPTAACKVQDISSFHVSFEESEPNLNELVILKDDNAPPLYWPLGRIMELHRGNDGHVRVVSVKVGNKIFKRAITQVCPMPSETSSVQNLLVQIINHFPE